MFYDYCFIVNSSHLIQIMAYKYYRLFIFLNFINLTQTFSLKI